MINQLTNRQLNEKIFTDIEATQAFHVTNLVRQMSDFIAADILKWPTNWDKCSYNDGTSGTAR